MQARSVLLEKYQIPEDLKEFFEPANCGQCYVCHMTEMFHEVKRILKKEGTLWLNIGDTYCSDSTIRTAGIDGFLRKGDDGYDAYLASERHSDKSDKKRRTFKYKNLPTKCLSMIPERLAWSLIQDGWILRNKIVWSKPNAMPSSVKDRFSNKWEYLFMFSKNNNAILWQHENTREWVYKQPPGTQGKEGIDWEWRKDNGKKKKVSLWHGFTYYFDLDAVKKPVAASTIGRGKVDFGGAKGRDYNPDENDPNYRGGNEQWGRTFDYQESCKNGVNPGDVFEIPSETRSMGAIIGDSGAVKVPGGKGWTGHPKGGGNACQKDPRWCPPDGKNPGDFWEIPTQPFPEAHFAVFPERLCEKPIKAGCPEGGIFLDPFCGAGTSLYVAKQLRRKFIGIDIKSGYCEMSDKRLAQGVL